MLAPNPADRPSFAGLLARFRGAVFPEVFYTFLHEFACSLADLRLGTPGAAGGGEAEAPAGGAGEGEARTAAVADEKVARLWDDWDVIKSYLDTDAGEAAAPGEGSNSEGGVSHGASSFPFPPSVIPLPLRSSPLTSPLAPSPSPRRRPGPARPQPAHGRAPGLPPPNLAHPRYGPDPPARELRLGRCKARAGRAVPRGAARGRRRCRPGNRRPHAHHASEARLLVLLLPALRAAPD